ncbi:glycosyltransferase family 2 protein [Sulfurospirillum oryzae]|uniref:glycosyltransferase family 2 protein n=1 Tax=Sulfurospirillum oryzae TaxID=2976535 RepID=UPI0021E867BF|nr:glycosyltransferase family 2 protein [Sulfurospirillum oryzae]
MVKISVTILTKNSEEHIKKCLEALQSFDEIIILDNGSTDDTLKIAQQYPNVKIVKHEFIGFGPLKNLAIQYAQNDWIFSIDSDEIATPALINEIQSIKFDKNIIYAIKRSNFYGTKKMQCCGWDNDFVKRIFHKQSTKFSDDLVHESLLNNGLKIKKLNNELEHYSFKSADELIDKMQKYSTLWAQDKKGKKRASPLQAVVRAFFTFIKFYFLKKGFLNGYEGLVISISNANGTFYKYIKLYENNKR